MNMRYKIFMSVLLMSLLCSFTLACAQGIPDESNALVIEDDGEIFDTTTKGYSETGTWANSNKGFENRDVHISNESKAQAKWSITPSERTYYDVYLWKDVCEGGDTSMRVDIYATGTSQATINIDMSQGVSQWVHAGVFYPSDGGLNVTISGSGAGSISACALRIVKTTQEKFYEFRDSNGSSDGEIIFTVGGDTAVVNGKETALTMGKAVIIDDRTLVPVRFITETMGGKAEWLESERKASISANGNTVDFFIGSNICLVNGENKQMDTESVIIDGRTYVPVRYFAESAGFTVDYENKTVKIRR